MQPMQFIIYNYHCLQTNSDKIKNVPILSGRFFMFVVKECNTYPSSGIRTIVITTIKKMGVASQFADYTGRYARGKEYGLSKSDSDKFFTLRTHMRYKEIPGVLLNGGL